MATKPKKEKCGRHYIIGYVNGYPKWAVCDKKKGHLFGGCKNGER